MIPKIENKPCQTTFDGKRVFIIGNGFDMALERCATFNDFYKSTYWKETSKYDCPLRRYMVMWQASENWFDMERYLNYFTDSSNTFVPRTDVDKDLLFFKELTKQLALYIKSKSIPKNVLKKCSARSPLKKTPIAYQIFDEVLCAGDYSFFSFNYTDLKPLCEAFFSANQKEMIKQNINNCEQLHKRLEKGFEYIHGNLKNDNIIIGGGKNCHSEYNEISKKIRINGTKIKRCLKKAVEVIFYGHSLSEVDFNYFDDFFKSLLNDDCTTKMVKIFTRDNGSIIEIKTRMEEYNKEFSDLWDSGKVEFIPVDVLEKDPESLRKELEDISTNLRKKYGYI